jgi:hypothetical protein
MQFEIIVGEIIESKVGKTGGNSFLILYTYSYKFIELHISNGYAAKVLTLYSVYYESPVLMI